jgi:hypothetical protein
MRQVIAFPGVKLADARASARGADGDAMPGLWVLS